MKQVFIEQIKTRLTTLVKCCSAIRTLNGVIVLYDNSLVLNLDSLKASWDSDRRPMLSNNETLAYIDFENLIFITDFHTKFPLDSIEEEDLKKIYFYFEQMVPTPIKDEISKKDM